MSRRKPYVRPQSKTWYLSNTWYTKYMVREASSVFVTIYCLVLLTGLWALVRGEAAFNGWVEAMSSPLSIVFHLAALAMTVVHMVTWFKLIPVVMPTQFGPVKMPAAEVLIKSHYAVTGLVSLAFLLMAM